MNRLISTLAGMWLMVTHPPARDERGGNGGGIEALLLIAGSIIVAGLVVAGVKTYVGQHMP